MLKDYPSDYKLIAGCDEAGRGCLAGPVFAAAVILPKGFKNEELNDSKKLKESARIRLSHIIREEAVAWAVASCDNHEIDKINILNASILAMHKAVSCLQTVPDLLLIDGNRFKKYHEIPHECIIKGDGIYKAIAAASILAKTERDKFMLDLHREFPHYQWDRNKAYATESHRNALNQFGSSPYHRKSFRLDYRVKLEF